MYLKEKHPWVRQVSGHGFSRAAKLAKQILPCAAGPPRGNPCGFPCRAAPARQKKERHPAKLRVSRVGLCLPPLPVEERPFRAAKSKPKPCHLEGARRPPDPELAKGKGELRASRKIPKICPLSISILGILPKIPVFLLLKDRLSFRAAPAQQKLNEDTRRGTRRRAIWLLTQSVCTLKEKHPVDKTSVRARLQPCRKTRKTIPSLRRRPARQPLRVPVSRRPGTAKKEDTQRSAGCRGLGSSPKVFVPSKKSILG